jgi:polyphosphate glucokinase
MTSKHGDEGPHTLALDIGGTGLKATILDSAGQMVVKRARMPTPYPCQPDTMLGALGKLIEPLPPFDRVSMGFPGVIRNGRVITAPHFGTAVWRDYPLEEAAARLFEKPTRLLNDAEVQGLGIVSGQGFEVVLTLGTGLGSALFDEGQLAPHLELAHHPIRGRKTYNDYVGEAARKAISSRKWNRRVRRMIDIVYDLLHYDVLHVGGGNSSNIKGELPANVHLASNDAGLTGGIRLWDDKVWRAVPEQKLQQ